MVPLGPSTLQVALGFPRQDGHLKSGTMSPPKGGPAAGINTALPSRVQEGGRPALSLLEESDPEDSRRAGLASESLSKVDQATRSRRRRARGAEQAPAREQDTQTGKGVPEETAVRSTCPCYRGKHSCKLLCLLPAFSKIKGPMCKAEARTREGLVEASSRLLQALRLPCGGSTVLIAAVP